MHFTKAVLATLALNLFANALPILEDIGSLSNYESRVKITGEDHKGELQRRTKVTGLNPKASEKKSVNLDGKHATDVYRSGTDLTKYKTNRVADIMESWQEGTKKMRGPYVAVPGKKKLVNVLMGQGANLKMDADHIFEAQTISDFLLYLQKEAKRKWSKADLINIFLANHKTAYTDKNDNTAKTQRAKAPDYTQDTYYGSLLQHMMAELGSLRNPDRMALLSGDAKTNTRKGFVWSQSNAKKDVEVAYDLARINDYMIEVKDGFCATLNGIYKVLQDFHKARMGDPMDGLCALFDDTTIKTRNTDSEPEPPSSDSDSDYNPSAGSAYNDKDRPKLTPKYAKEQDYSFHDDFVTFMKKHIKEVGDKMQTNIDSLVGSVTIPTGGDSLTGFKVTFPAELLKCSSLRNGVNARQVKAPNNGGKSSSSSRACSRSSTRTSTKSGATSTRAPKATEAPTKTTLVAETKPTSSKKDDKPSPDPKPVDPKPSPNPKPVDPKPADPKPKPCKKGKKC